MAAISIGPLKINDQGEAYYSTAKVNHLTSKPVTYKVSDSCGFLLSKGLSTTNVSGRDDCTDQVNPIMGFSGSYTGSLDRTSGDKVSHNSNSVADDANIYLATTALVKAAYTNAGWEDRGTQLVKLFPNGRVEESIAISTYDMLDSCDKVIGKRRRIVHTVYSYDSETCEYRQAFVEVYKFYWNPTFVQITQLNSLLSQFYANFVDLVEETTVTSHDNTALSGVTYTVGA